MGFHFQVGAAYIGVSREGLLPQEQLQLTDDPRS